MPNIENINFASSLSGLGNYKVQPASIVVPVTSIGAFSFTDFTTSVNIERSDSVGQVQIKYTGIETQTRMLTADRHILYIPNFAGATDTIQVFYSTSGATTTLIARVGNPTAGAKNCPAFTLDATFFLFVAPF